MNEYLNQFFSDAAVISLVKRKLPESFFLAEIDCSRAGKVGMEVGSLRETILISLLTHYFGDKYVNTEIPITDSETDVLVYSLPISIKTKTGTTFGGIKASWTVDAESAKLFKKTYQPNCDMLLALIAWEQTGYLYYIPAEAQVQVFNSIGIEKYLNLPKEGTNPRGVEFSSVALSTAIEDRRTKKISIDWVRPKTTYNKYKRWIDFWNE